MIKVNKVDKEGEKSDPPVAYVTETFIPLDALYKKEARDEEEGFFEVPIKDLHAKEVTRFLSVLSWAGNSTVLGYVFLIGLCCLVTVFLGLFFGATAVKDIVIDNVDVNVLLHRGVIEVMPEKAVPLLL
jgi:hypothetical protein